MRDIKKKIIEQLPFGPSFTFIDEIVDVNANGVVGNYTFKKEEIFYAGHFPEKPVIPGVIMIETMAQIGLVCYFIFIMMTEKNVYDFSKIEPALTSCETEFLKPVFPGEKVTVRSRKVYFRLNKFKCYVEMANNKEEIVCKGHLSGIYLKN